MHGMKYRTKFWQENLKTTHLENLKSRKRIRGFGLDPGGPGQGQASIMKVHCKSHAMHRMLR